MKAANPKLKNCPKYTATLSNQEKIKILLESVQEYKEEIVKEIDNTDKRGTFNPNKLTLLSNEELERELANAKITLDKFKQLGLEMQALVGTIMILACKPELSSKQRSNLETQTQVNHISSQAFGMAMAKYKAVYDSYYAMVGAGNVAAKLNIPYKAEEITQNWNMENCTLKPRHQAH